MSGARADDTAGSTTYCAPELLVGRGVSATVDTDLWALGCVILEICSGHLFQTRKDRLVLGRVALEDGQDGKQSWKTVRDKLLSDMVSKTNKLKPLVLGLLSIEPEKRTNLVHFLETEPDAFLEPVKKKDAAADAKAGAAGAPNGKAGDDAAREKGGSDSAEEQAVRTKTGGGAGKLKAAVAGGTPSREPSIAKGVEAGGADSAAASNDLSDDSEMNPINWGKEQVQTFFLSVPQFTYSMNGFFILLGKNGSSVVGCVKNRTTTTISSSCWTACRRQTAQACLLCAQSTLSDLTPTTLRC